MHDEEHDELSAPAAGVADRTAFAGGSRGAGAEAEVWRARLDAGGIDALEAAELLALVLGGLGGAAGQGTAARPRSSGRRRTQRGGDGRPTSLGLRTGDRLLARAGLVELSVTPWGELCGIEGLGRARALRLSAAFALGRRVERAGVPPRCSMRSPSQVHRLLAPEFRGVQRESFVALLLDGKHRLRRRETVSVGTLTSSLVHPREFFRPAVREAAAAVIAVHNHPSGDPEPSPEDLEVTRRLVEVGRLLGVPLLDHVVIGAGRYVSLKERLRW